jgi:ABC-type multidrug transport system fused ATPase/permease subunit
MSLLLGGESATPMRPLQWMEAQFPGHSPGFYVAGFCVAIVVTIGLKNAAGYVSQRFSAALKRRVAISLRDALFERLQRADLDTFDRRPGGELANVFLVETTRTTAAIDSVVGLLQRSAVALVYVSALFYVSWPLTMMVVALALGLGSALSIIYQRLGKAGAELTDLNHRIASALEQGFAGVRIVRATNSQQREIERFRRLNVAQADAEAANTEASSLMHPITETLAVLGAMTIVGCAYVFFVRPGLMLSSYLLGYGFFLLRLLPLLTQLYQIQGHLFYLAGGIREVEKWLNTPIFPERPFGSVEFSGIEHELRFEDVSYVYPSGTQALNRVSFTVPAGRTVAIVGPSGSGKSTLATQLLRLRAPTGGRITVDGRDCWNFSPESWHRATAVVEQDAFLFFGTLRDNILYGWQHATDAMLQEAIATANLEEMVASLPDGVDTLVGERGAMVSGGQRQRIAIARAVVRNPSILILDEATSHLDSVSEQLVQQALWRAAHGRTTVVIAHRLSTIREANWIVVLEHGVVAEQGTWETLHTARGTFERLLQALAT